MAVERRDRLHDIEAIICQLRDVISARVIADASGEIEEVHVLTESTRTPKQVVRDIESALMARLGLPLDHRKVSVAQLQGGDKKDQSRLKFSDVSISLQGSKAEATVRLKRDGSVFEGNASGMNSSSSQMRLVATATLLAVENAGAGDGSMVIEDLTTSVSLGAKNIAVVLIDVMSERGDDFLSGCAVVRQDLWRAVVNATLDAINRRATLPTED